MNYQDQGNRFLLLYGSQTGQAQAIAEEIFERAPDYNFEANLHCLSSIDKKFTLEKESVIVFVVSTTGEGDPPETALKFWKRLKKITLSDRYLSHLKYTLLGLGDSNYSNFAKFGKTLDKRLKQLGAIKFTESRFADDATGLDVVAEPWISNLWQSLKDVLQCKSDDILHTHHQTIIELSKDSDIIIEKLTQVDNKLEDNQNTEVMLTEEEDKTAISLANSTTFQSDMQLNLPPVPKSVIKLKFDETNYENCDKITRNQFPLAVSDVKYASLTSAIKLTNEDAKKSVLEISLDISDTELSFQPGDCFGIICQNNDEEVQLLIDRLDINALADLNVNIGLIADDSLSKKKVNIPSHLPAYSSIRQILLKYCDIRAVPKKPFIRLLVECTSDMKEKRRLQELCSRQGSEEYNTLIREQGVCLLDLLMEFRSCKPTIETILEHLPPLQARPYSVANFLNSDIIRCVFSIVEIEKMKGHYTKRMGVCTSWLDKISRSIQISKSTNKESTLNEEVAKLSLVDSLKIGIFKRKSTGFNLPQDPTIPIIMICAGTGIAPFIGFLECRHEQHQNGIINKNWLIFGCRDENNDFLYKEKIELYCNSNTLDKFSLALSQSSTEKARYVQDVIKKEAEEFVYWITEMKAIIYVCGDVKNMMKDVRSKVEECLMEQKSLSKESATAFVQDLQDKKLYLQDIWS